MTIEDSYPMAEADGPKVPREGSAYGTEMVDEAPAAPAAGGVATYFNALRRRWFLSLVLGLLCAAAAGPAVWFSHRPSYTATAMLKIAASQEKILPTAGELDGIGFELYKATQRQYLSNRSVLTAALRQKEVLDKETIDVGRLPVVLEQLDPVDWLAREISVSFPGSAEFMSVSLRGDDPAAMAALVNAVVDAYMTEVVNVEQERRRQRLSEIDRMYGAKESEWRRKRTDLKDLGKLIGGIKSEVVAIKQQTMLHQLAAFRTELVSTQLRKMRLETELVGRNEELRRLEEQGQAGTPGSKPPPAADPGKAASPSPTVTTWVSQDEVDAALRLDPLGARLLSELNNLGQSKADAQVSATPAGAAMAAQRNQLRAESLQSQLAVRREEVREELQRKKPGAMAASVRAEIQRLQTELAIVVELEKRLSRNVDMAKVEADQVGGQSIEVEIMAQEITLLEGVLRQLADQRQTMAIELQAKQPRVTIVYRAVPPVAPDRGRKYQNTAAAMLAAMCLPILGLVWWDTRARRISSADEVSAQTGLDIIGSVPQLPSDVVRRRGRNSGRARYWRMLMNESIDGIAARLLYRAERDEIRVVLVSSAMSGEGKTTLSTQLAMSLARTGRRTLLVDFDLRQPVLDQVFAIPPGPGVSDVLHGDCDLSQAIQPTAMRRLWVMPAGEGDRQALVALANGSIRSLLKELRAEFDFVILDGSPILPVVDARLVCRHVDGVVLSVLRDVSQVPRILAACDVLAGFGIRPLGAVVVGSVNEIGYYYPRVPAISTES